MTKSVLGSEGSDYFSSRGTSADLVVLIHGFRGSPAGLEPVMTALTQMADLGNADFFAPRLPFGLFSHAHPVDVVASIVDKIDKQFDKRKPEGTEYQRFYLIGHSMGGVFARRAYVCAWQSLWCSHRRGTPRRFRGDWR